MAAVSRSIGVVSGASAIPSAVRDRWDDERMVSKWSKQHENNTVGELTSSAFSSSDRQPRLTNATRPGQRQ